MLEAIRTWLTILVCWPAPAGPWCTIVLPMTSKRGRKASTTSFSPPIMIDSRASCAPTSPPETGASTAWTFLARAAWSISIARAGSLVVMSTRTVPGFAPASVPCVPQRDLAHVLRVADDRENHVRRLRRPPGAESASLAPFSTSCPGLVGRAVIDGRRVASRDQVAAHRSTHHARADPADPRLCRRKLESHGMLPAASLEPGRARPLQS